jgi:hypothetical protein
MKSFKVKYLVFAALLLVFSACKKENGLSPEERSLKELNELQPIPVNLTFYKTEAAIGTVTVTIESENKTISVTSTSGSCGATGSANFNLSVGSHDYTATDGIRYWAGTVVVSNGHCTVQRIALIDALSGDGEATFWNNEASVNVVYVTINGVTEQITSTTIATYCNYTGSANFSLSYGTYSYSATDGTYNWSGTVSVTPGGCTLKELNIANSGGGSSTGDVMFWLQSDLGHGYISVYVDGTYRGQITNYYSGTPTSCGVTGLTVALSPGNHTWNATAGTYYWPASGGTGTVTVTDGGCFKMQLTN